MKPMPTAILPADSEYIYIPETDEWKVQTKSTNKILSKKDITASLDIISRLQLIKANILKEAVQKQDVVDFYLLSLLPAEYLSRTAIGPEHLNGLTIYQGIIESLRDEYVRRGMYELKDEAETTKWTKAIPEEDIAEEIKPYYKYHEKGYAGDDDYDDDEDLEPEYPYYCNNCGTGLSEYDVSSLDDENYCPDCIGKAVTTALEENVLYCSEHNVFVIDAAYRSLKDDLKESLQAQNYKVADIEDHENDTLLRYNAGQKAWQDVKENLQKQLKSNFRERKPKEKASNLYRPLSKKAGWYEAPEDFTGLTSSDYYKLFEYAPWKHLYGGPAWAEIAKTINQMEHETNWQKLALLIDHFHDLGHNTGKLLDKFPEWTKWFKKLLDLKASKNAVRQLIPLASPEVRNLVQEYYAVERGEDWKKQTYPTTDFSKNDLSAILQDPHVPSEVLFNAAKFSTDGGDPYTVVSLINHQNMDKTTLQKLLSYIDSQKSKLPEYFIPHINQELERMGLIEKQQEQFNLGDKVIDKHDPNANVATITGLHGGNADLVYKNNKFIVVPVKYIQKVQQEVQENFKVGDRVILEADSSVGIGTVVELLTNGFVSVKWDSPAEGEYPSTYLPDSLTKISSLNRLSKKDIKAVDDKWPGQKDPIYWGIAPINDMAYEPWKRSSSESTPENLSETIEYYINNPHKIHGRIVDMNIKDRTLKFEDGFVISFDDISNILKESRTDIAPKPDRGSDDPEVNDYAQNYEWGPMDLGRVHQHSPADTGYLPAGTEDYDGVSSNVMMSSFSSFMRKTSVLKKIAHCGPCSALKMEALHILIDLSYKDESLFPVSLIEGLSVAATELKLDAFNSILEETISHLEKREKDAGDKLLKLKNLLVALKDINPKLGKEISIVDKPLSKKEAWQSTEPVCICGDKLKDHWWAGTPEEFCKFCDCKKFIPKTNKEANLNKQANPPSRFWIAPDGQEFPVFSAGHGAWIKQNAEEILPHFGLQAKGKNIGQINDEMIDAGWARISNEPAGTGFYIEIQNLRSLPPYLEKFISKNYSTGDTLKIGEKQQGRYVEISDPFPSLQKAVNKELIHTKQASILDEVLSQETQNEIASKYGPSMLVAMRFYNDAMRYGQTPDRAIRYAVEELKSMGRSVSDITLTKVLNDYF